MARVPGQANRSSPFPNDPFQVRCEPAEFHVFGTVESLLGLKPAIILHDLTTIFCDGQTPGQPRALRSHSKVLTLGLVVDGSRLVGRSGDLAGDAIEARAPGPMPASPGAPVGRVHHGPWSCHQGQPRLADGKSSAFGFDDMEFTADAG